MSKKQIKKPKHVAIIMDGNRRWAKERNLPTLEGHSQGYEKMKSISRLFLTKGADIITFFAFSTENWNRSSEEVNYLMKLIGRSLSTELDDLVQDGYKLVISGRLSELPGDLPEICQEAMQKTSTNTKGIINICLNYGGQTEIVDAIRKIIKNNLTTDQIHEGIIKKYLYNQLPDPDIIIRTSGEQRLSGFMLWGSAYSELFFVKKYWPDFEELDVDNILKEYNERDRRFGE